ncbi:N-methyl-L-tryptophan oxidase [Vibrio sp. STUT-A11]|uniref:N-methyl-L-tryptophan oxidase n=1 Tax=Vibrio sp. STUT-A11 TaxID=2976236 RepID=UPI00222FC6CE|nr:N-methyl-L-tryptophan oxidase [Vibrio sp. STUT-A11]BDR15089.1 N-methyltryptophan oxidase [Vibrio sp. STUT-A11]
MQYDVIVVGAGSMGMSTGYFLAKQGKKVLLLDAFDPPHSHASHHGETRIIRHAYGEGEEYVPLALRAQELWGELEQLSGKSLFLKTGVLNIGDERSPFISMLIASAKKHQLPLEILSADEANQRFEGLNLPPEYIGCFESTSGVLRVEDCIQAYRYLALAHGATLLTHHKVSGVELLDDGVSVAANGNTFQGKKLVVSVGAWSNDLLDMLGVTLPISPIRKTFAWYNAPEALYGEGTFPAFSFVTPEGIYYGFPSIDGAGLKIGRHDLGDDQDPNAEITPFDNQTDSADLQQLLDKHMPHVESLKFGKTCMYTRTPDENFIIDKHPENDNVVLVSGFSGHGFKFASVIGEVVADIAIDKPAKFNLSLFSVDRFK